MSADSVINSQGRKLLDMCSTTDFNILNGSYNYANGGNYTFFGHQGNSVIDYVLSSSNMMISHFEVAKLTEHSDHCPLHLGLKVKEFRNEGITTTQKRAEQLVVDCLSDVLDNSRPIMGFRWKENNVEKLLELMNSGVWVKTLQSCLENGPALSTDNCIEIFQNVLMDAASSVGAFNQQSKRKQVQQARVHQPWFDEDCRHSIEDPFVHCCRVFTYHQQINS